VVGLCGVLLAVLVSGFNENITKVALADIRGAMGFSVDDGSWIVAIYSAMSVSAMAFAPWCAATFSLRRFALAMIGGFMVLGVLCPLAPNLQVFLLLRAAGPVRRCAAAAADERGAALPAPGHQAVWPGRLR
jgi:DHA2 family multidrug resistance protein